MSDLYSRRVIVVVPASRQAEANTKAAVVDRAGGNQTFTVGLSATGSAPATHYWCSSAATPAHWDSVVAAHSFAANGPAGRYSDGLDAWLYDGLLWQPAAVLADRGLQRLGQP